MRAAKAIPYGVHRIVGSMLMDDEPRVCPLALEASLMTAPCASRAARRAWRLPCVVAGWLAACRAPSVPTAVSDNALIPIEELFGNPTAAQPLVSPDGAWIAYLTARGDALNVAVRPVASGPPVIGRDRFVTDDRRPVSDFLWSGDARSILYFQDRGGNEGYHLIQADVEGGRVRDLTPFDGIEAALVGLPARAAGLVVITLNRRDPELADAYRIDLASGALELAAENPGSFTSYLADPRGQVLVAMSIDEHGQYRLHHRVDEASAWRVVATYPVEDDVALLAWSDQPGRIYARSNHGSDLQRVVLLDLASGAEQVVAEDPDHRVDLDAALIDPTSGQFLAARFADDRARWVTRDPAFGALVAATDAGANLSVLSWSRDRRVWTLGISAPTTPQRYAAVGLRAPGARTPLFSSRPLLDHRRLAATEPIRIRARDGVALSGYLTRPTHGARAPYPTVLAVHGGPWSRDTWDFDNDRQFLADRGYAVLSVNYRGSTGYGKRFAGMARKAFSTTMQDDLLDAVDWAVAQRVTDPRRVAILGGSYGGYAALVGLTATPDRFACGVDYAGPVDLVTLIEAFPPSWRPFLGRRWYPYVGDPRQPEDRADLQRRSPISRVDQIRAPLLIFQGANDPRVSRAQSDAIARALHRRGVPVTYLLASNEGHSFGTRASSLAVNRATELFLARCLGGRAAPSASPAIAGSLADLTVDVSHLPSP
jgi:dipeptidyl aminopeptidase/acylaminoacyl peptidase